MRHTARDRAPLPERERDVHFDSHGWLPTRILDRNALASGDELQGPCVIEELDGYGGRAARAERPGGRRRQPDHRSGRGAMTSTGATRPERIDPITFEVLRNAFESIVDEMGLMLERVAHSLVVSEGRDFSAAICDPDGRLVAEGKDDLPAHVGTLPHTVKAVIEWLGKDRLAEGDIILMNDPFLGGTHAQERVHQAGVLRGRAGGLRPELGALVGCRRACPGKLSRRGHVDLRRGALHPADPPRPRRRARRRGDAIHPAQRSRPGDHPGRRLRADRGLRRGRARRARPGSRSTESRSSSRKWTS